MNPLQLAQLPRKMVAIPRGVPGSVQEPAKVDIRQRGRAAGEPLPALRDVCRRQQPAEGVVERRPVMFGRHA